MPDRHFAKRNRRSLLLAAAWACTVLVGCGTDAYQQQYEATLLRLRHETPFRDLYGKPVDILPESYPPQGELSNASFTLRLPRFFQRSNSYAFDETSPEPRKPTEPLDPSRVQPTFLKLPGYQRTYEGFTQVKGRQSNEMISVPIYLYIAIAPAHYRDGRQLTSAELEKQLRDPLVRQFGKDVTQWEPVELQTPAGEMLPWKRLKAIGEQYFASYQENYPTDKFYRGVYLLYLHSTPDYHVMLAWRCGSDAAAAVPVESLANACAGTVQVTLAPAAAAP